MFDLDFPAARLSIGVNSDARELVLIAAEGPDDDSGNPPLMLRFEFRQGAELRQQVLDVVAAGRPPCPLCGGARRPGRARLREDERPPPRLRAPRADRRSPVLPGDLNHIGAPVAPVAWP